MATRYIGTITVTLGNLEDIKDPEYQPELTAASMGNYFFHVDTPTALLGSYNEWEDSDKSEISWFILDDNKIAGTFEFECSTGFTDERIGCSYLRSELLESVTDSVCDALQKGMDDDECGPEGSSFYVFNLDLREYLREQLGKLKDTRQNISNAVGSGEFQSGDFCEVYAPLSDSIEKLENIIFYPEYNKSMYVPIIAEDIDLKIEVA